MHEMIDSLLSALDDTWETFNLERALKNDDRKCA